jgi:hypothetical protein
MRLKVITAKPTEVYVILRVSGLDALRDGASFTPQWRAYLDPCTLSEEGFLAFKATSYAVTASR